MAGEPARITVKDVSDEAVEPYRSIKSLEMAGKRGPTEAIDVTEEETGLY
jgi:hypothetical protein